MQLGFKTSQTQEPRLKVLLRNKTKLRSKTTVNFYQIRQRSTKQLIKQVANRAKTDLNSENRSNSLPALKVFQSYKHKDRLIRRNVLASRSNPPLLQYVSYLQSKNIKPESLKLFDNNLAQNINLKHYSIGDVYAGAFSQGIQANRSLKVLDLQNNRLSQKSITEILQNSDMSKLKSLNLQDNYIGQRSLQKLVKTIQTTQIKHLNLEHTRLTSKSLQSIAKSFQQNLWIKTLNLSRNRIADECSFFNLIQNLPNLKKLYLYYNSIRQESLISLCKALQNHTNLKILDLSWNAIGRNTNQLAIERLGKMLQLNKSLIHLDLSGNQFNQQESLILAEHLKFNHQVQGLHFEGNNGSIDQLGFIIPQTKMFKQNFLHLSKRISNNSKIITKSNCWICENWVDCKFVWNPNLVSWNRKLKDFAFQKLKEQREPVFIHLEIDDWQPYLLQQGQNATYFCKRAVPSGKIRFFFTYRGFAQIVNNYQFEGLERMIMKSVHFYKDFYKDLQIVVVNSVDAKVKQKQIKCLPRIQSEQYQPKSGDIIEPLFLEWKLQDALFYPQPIESEEHVIRCFEYDWNLTNIQKIIKDESMLEESKQFLKLNYKTIRQCYQYLTSLGHRAQRFLVTINTLTDFMNQCNVIDQKNFGLSALDLQIKSTISKRKFQLDTQFGLVRHEFLEVLVRSAIDKYKGVQSLQKFFTQHILPTAQKYDFSQWRVQRFYNEDCDEVLTSYQTILRQKFEMYSSKFIKYSKQSFMTEDSFIQFCQDNLLFNQYFNQRHAIICYHISLVTHINELDNNRYMLMTFKEFLEAFSRVAEVYQSEDPDTDLFREFDESEDFLDEKIDSLFLDLL